MNTKDTDNYLEVFGCTCQGLVRKSNQDSVLAMKEHGVFAVSDGMGGGYEGGKASEMCITALKKHVSEAVRGPGALEHAVIYATYEVSDAISAYPRPKDKKTMGTTLACMLFNPWNTSSAMIAHAGDSRIYLMRGNVLSSLTIDHTVANSSLSDKKTLFINREALTNYVGLDKDKGFYLSRQYTDVLPDDCFIICTDGLNKMVPVEEMEIICRRAWNDSAETICRQLINQALWYGGKDNISCIVIRVHRLPVPYEPKPEEQEVDNAMRVRSLQILSGKKLRIK